MLTKTVGFCSLPLLCSEKRKNRRGLTGPFPVRIREAAIRGFHGCSEEIPAAPQSIRGDLPTRIMDIRIVAQATEDRTEAARITHAAGIRAATLAGEAIPAADTRAAVATSLPGQ